MKKNFGAIFLCTMILFLFAGCNQDSTYDTDSSNHEGSLFDIFSPDHENSTYDAVIPSHGSSSDDNNNTPDTESIDTGDDCESLIKAALSSSDIYVFQIENDFEFDIDTAGANSWSADGNYSGSAMDPGEVKGRLENFLYHKVIRISEDSVIMDDAEYSCSITVLPGEQGIGISINRGNSMSVNQGQLQGVIKGDTLYANAYVSTNTVINGVGNGAGSGGDFTVSIRNVPLDEQPPIAVINVIVTENSDHSMLLTWDDPNPAGSVVSYDIYRICGFSDYTGSIATVTDGTSWVDTSDEAKTVDTILSYSVIAIGANGSQSEFSVYADADVMGRMFAY